MRELKPIHMIFASLAVASASLLFAAAVIFSIGSPVFMKHIAAVLAIVSTITGLLGASTGAVVCFKMMRKDAATSGTVVGPPDGFPKWWKLFRFLLPASVQDRVYEPCLFELEQDYLRAAPLWVGKWPRRWLRFCFTLKSLNLVALCLWESAGAKGRKLIVVLLVAMIGPDTAGNLRTWFAGKFGRLP